MKILDKYIIKSFMITFTTVFVILFFIFVLQGIWLFIAELAGKDLDFFTIIKFLSFYAPTIVPLVLPLSILLAGIMTFGSFAENYEFAAMKSSGISLQRAMKILTITIGILAFVSFFFANNVIPEAQYKFINLRKTIVQQKPAMAIAEGQFNTIGTSNIKVDKKSGDNGEFLEGVTMHVKNNNMGLGANTIIKAKRGLLTSEDDSNYLQLELYDGYYYEDIHPKKYEERNKMPFAKSSFKKYVINIDLTKLNQAEMDNGEITSEKMLTVPELKYTIDSLQKSYNKDVISFADNIVQRNDNVFNKKMPNSVVQPNVKENETRDLLSIFSKIEKRQILEMAKNNVSSTEFSIHNSKTDLEHKSKNINSHWLAIHEKFVIAYSCLLMFFIGAPLGAIIRKGGLGLPIVFAMLIFISFHFINTFGRKLAQEDTIPPFLGAWLASILMTPFAILLTYRATNDIGIMVNFDWITDPIKKLFNKKNTSEIEFKKEIVSLDTIQLDQNDLFVKDFMSKETSVLMNIVKNSEQFNYNSGQRLIALKILEIRGISQHELLEKNSLFNESYLRLTFLKQQYNSFSNLAIVFYIISFVFSALSTTNKFIIIALGLIILFLFYIFNYKSQQNLEEISKITNRNNFTNIYIALLFGFPFFLLIYLYNKKQLKEAVSEFSN
ncbi:LptF/LptG family permease [uncultured Flavobacterium sp.]|uniref:LptF/LptG family permease n=1 Tax=uncultured Flavobacterium sp. TaxID=165435 RepID=UPI00338F1093